MVLTLDRAHGVDEGLLLLDGVSTYLQQGQYEGGEFVAHRQARKADVDGASGAGDGKGGGALIVDGLTDAHFVRQGGDLG